MVEPQNYRVTFTKLVGQSWWDKKERAVLEIRVQPGEPFDMYEDIAHEVRVCGWVLWGCGGR